MEQSYKEKYEQAIERLKQWDREHPCAGYVLSDRDKFIFPELAESEGEKVREEIMALIEWSKSYSASGITNDDAKKMLAWLEKQGQVKESTISQHENRTCKENGNSLTYDDERIINIFRKVIYGCNKGEMQMLGDKERDDCLAWLERQGEHANFRNMIQVGDKVTRNEAGVLVNISQLRRVAKPSEKQCEQKFEMKTAEESLGIDSDTYNKIIDECIYGDDKVEPKFKVGDKIYLKPEYRMPDDDTPIANTVKEIRRIDDKHYRFDGSYIFIEDQDKYELVEQKPEKNKGNIGGISSNSEWSEEDERIKNNLISSLLRISASTHTDSTSPNCTFYKEIDWLQSLKCRVQPKQEWSEEDEEHIDSLLKRLDALCRNKFERTRFAISEDRDWLQSLRPQNRWKPSETDIMILEKVFSGKIDPKDFQVTLSNVLEQLKKLKEGKV